MLRVVVEMVPFGMEEMKFVHSEAIIFNDSTGTKQKGNYKAKFYQSYKFNPKKIWKSSVCKGLHRVKRGVWDLLFVALYNAGLYERNKHLLNKK